MIDHVCVGITWRRNVALKGSDLVVRCCGAAFKSGCIMLLQLHYGKREHLHRKPPEFGLLWQRKFALYRTC